MKEGRKAEGEKDCQESVTEQKGYIMMPTLTKFDPVPFKRLNSPSMGTTQPLFHQLLKLLVLMAEESRIKVSMQPQLEVFTSFKLGATSQDSRKNSEATVNTEGDKST